MEKIGENANIKKIAITGIIASGKSALCSILKKKGAYVISSDEVVHQIYSQNKELQARVIDEFGEGIVSRGEIDREKLGNIVFHDINALKRLEGIVHPYVKNAIKETYNLVKDQNYSAFVVELPLLFEMSLNSWFELNVTVSSPEEECRQRFDKIHGKGAFDRRMSFQFSQSEKERLADLIIENNGSLDDLERKAKNI